LGFVAHVIIANVYVNFPIPFPTTWTPSASAPGQVWRWSASMPALRGNLWKVRQKKFEKPKSRRGAGSIASNFISYMIGLS